MNDPVPELKKLLGEPVVFINWPKGTKGTKKKWGDLTAADMTPAYLATLKNANIGVALGEVSGGLCAIDLDNDEFVEPFLELNANLKATLQTHGARGRVFWIRFKGEYPRRSNKLKTKSGEAVGEFRSNGNQSIVWGIHPDTKKPYEIVVREPVVEIELGSIKWPDQIARKPQCTEEDRRDGRYTSHSVSSVSSVPSVSSVSSVSSVHDWSFQVRTLEDALGRSLPKRKHQNNHLLFLYARGVKAVEAHQGEFTPEQLREAFDRWYTRALPFLRDGQSKEDYFMEFLNAYRRAKYPLGSTTIPKAWKLAQEEPLPPKALQFENQKLRLLVALCRQLQILAGKEAFYLSSRVCQRLLEQDSHTTAASWLQALCALQIIEEVEKGRNRRASRYRYLPS